MASPPPSGPNQPPYQPYPQQPYPQQYPPPYPQQPYYAPAVPPPKKDNTLLIIVVVIIVIIVAVALAGLYFFFVAMNTANQFAKITVSGVSFTVTYNGPSTGYFGNQITTCSVCPISVNLYSQFTYTLPLHNSDAVTHSVNAISLTGSNFQLTSVAPTLPANVAAGTSTDFTLTIQPSALAGTYTLAGAVGTS